MNFIKTSLLLSVFAFSNISFGQEEIIIIDKYQNKKDRKEKEIVYNDNTSVFKFAPLNMLVGEINFGYEKQLSKNTSVDFEFGPTLSKISLFINDDHLGVLSGPAKFERSGLGFLASIGYRFYPSTDTEALNRFYVSPIFKYKVYNHTIEDVSGILDDVGGSNTSFNFLFNFGYQKWVSELFSLDFYAGLGLGYQSLVDYNPTSIVVNNDFEYSWDKDADSGARYVFSLGIKVGFGQK